MTRSTGRLISDVELRRVARLIAAPELSPELLETVAARRARGERVTLYPVRQTFPLASRLRRTAFTLVAIAAVLLVALVARSRDRAPQAAWTASDLLGMGDMGGTCAGFYSNDSLGVSKRLANVILDVPRQCPSATFDAPPLTIVDASQIPTGIFAYVGETITDDAFTSHENLGSFTVSRVEWHGTPAILAIRDGPFIERVSFDSLIVSAQDLKPLHLASWYRTQHPVGSIHVDFDSNSATITITGRSDTAGRFPYTHTLARLPHEWWDALVVPSLPLSAEWESTIDVAAPFHPHTHKYFMGNWQSVSMRVVGQERVTVPAGTFKCWKLAVNSATAGPWIWIDVDHHFVVKSQSVSSSPRAKFDDRVELSRYVLTTR